MKIAVTAMHDAGPESPVGYHFGRSPYFAIVEVAEGKAVEVKMVPNPNATHHAPGELPAFIKQQGADVLITGGMGSRAIAFFTQYGIKVATGAQGTVGEAIRQYLNGTLRGYTPCQGQNECQ